MERNTGTGEGEFGMERCMGTWREDFRMERYRGTGEGEFGMDANELTGL